MLIRYKCKEGQDHIKCVPLIPTTDETKKLTLTRTQVQLLPGTNEVSADEWAVMQAHIQAEIKAGIIVAVSKNVSASGKGAKPGPAKNLQDMPVSIAIQYVADSVNPESLKKWHETETRDEVRLAIVKRMETLKIEIPNSGLEKDGSTDLDNDSNEGSGGKDFEKMTVEELKAYAAENEIEVSGNKADIIAAIKEAEAE